MKSAVRFAGDVFRGMLPSSVNEGLFRFAPDIGFAGLAAVTMPPELTGGERAAIIGEDLLYSLGAGSLGGGVSRALGKRWVARSKKLGDAFYDDEPKFLESLPKESAKQISDRIDTFANVGDLVTQVPAQMFAPRPFTDAAYRRINEEASAKEREESDAVADRNQQLENVLAVLGAGSVAAQAAMSRVGEAPVGLRGFNDFDLQL